MNDNQWHLDKRVNVAFALGVLTQTAVIIWWAAGINATVDRHERDIENLSDTHERLARIEAILERLEDRLDDADR